MVIGKTQYVVYDVVKGSPVNPNDQMG